MREVTANEVKCIRELLCAMIEVAVMDAKNNSVFKSHYKQAEIDQNREYASGWINGKVESKIKFQEVCDALGLESEPISDAIKPK